jgi:hypothetical protein
MPARPGPAKRNDEIGPVLPQVHGIRLDSHDFGTVHGFPVLVRFAIDDGDSPGARDQHGGQLETGRGHTADGARAAAKRLHRIAQRWRCLRARSGGDQ